MISSVEHGRRLKLLFISALVVGLTAACSGNGSGQQRAALQQTIPYSFSLGLDVPSTYQQACEQADGQCFPRVRGHIPDSLRRRLHLPSLGPHRRCPRSSGYKTVSQFFSGPVLGDGPVRPLIAGKATRHGTAVLKRSSAYPGWFSLTLVWLSPPTYDGPFVVRGKRLDGPGPLVFGTTPRRGPLVAPPGPSLSGIGGYRTVMDGAWVRGPGCYGWQVDGVGFSKTVVVRAVLANNASVNR